MKSYLLTDFNDKEWEDINIENIQFRLDEISDKECVHGQLFYPDDTFDITQKVLLSDITHFIDNITFYDNAIYGDVEFIKRFNGSMAKKYLENSKCKFKMRCIIDPDEKTIDEIITWDIVNNENDDNDDFVIRWI